MKSIISVALGIVAMLCVLVTSDVCAKEEGTSLCKWVDLFDPQYKRYVDSASEYACYVLTDDICELWSLDAAAVCKTTVRLSFHRAAERYRSDDRLQVIVLDKRTASVIAD
jgi:hypothetical protein